jgi:hypothetical protein
MQHAQAASIHEAPRFLAGAHFVSQLRELSEQRLRGLVSFEEYSARRAAKLDELLQPPRFPRAGQFLGGVITGAIGAGTTWMFAGDWRFIAFVSLLAGTWGLTSLGRLLREKFIQIQLGERLDILLALLDNDLISVGELAEYEDCLAKGKRAAL